MNLKLPALTEEKTSFKSSKKERRRPVTKGDVKAAFEELAKEGRPQTLESLVARVGGSKSTILRHLEELRNDEQPVQSSEPSSVSSYVLRALAIDIERAVKERCDQLECQLREAREAVRMLFQECEEEQESAREAQDLLEATNNLLAEQVGANKSLQDELAARANQVVSARTDAEQARQSLALCDARLRASEERRELLERELKDSRLSLTNANLEVQSVRGAASAMQADLAAKQKFLEHLQLGAEEGARYRQALEESLQRRATLEAERASLLERHAEAKNTLAKSEATVQRLLSKLLPSSQKPDPGQSPENPREAG